MSRQSACAVSIPAQPLSQGAGWGNLAADERAVAERVASPASIGDLCQVRRLNPPRQTYLGCEGLPCETVPNSELPKGNNHSVRASVDVNCQNKTKAALSSSNVSDQVSVGVLQNNRFRNEITNDNANNRGLKLEEVAHNFNYIHNNCNDTSIVEVNSCLYRNKSLPRDYRNYNKNIFEDYNPCASYVDWESIVQDTFLELQDKYESSQIVRQVDNHISQNSDFEKCNLQHTEIDFPTNVCHKTVEPTSGIKSYISKPISNLLKLPHKTFSSKNNTMGNLQGSEGKKDKSAGSKNQAKTKKDKKQAAKELKEQKQQAKGGPSHEKTSKRPPPPPPVATSVTTDNGSGLNQSANASPAWEALSVAPASCDGTTGTTTFVVTDSWRHVKKLAIKTPSTTATVGSSIATAGDLSVVTPPSRDSSSESVFTDPLTPQGFASITSSYYSDAGAAGGGDRPMTLLGAEAAKGNDDTSRATDLSAADPDDVTLTLVDSHEQLTELKDLDRDREGPLRQAPGQEQMQNGTSPALQQKATTPFTVVRHRKVELGPARVSEQNLLAEDGEARDLRRHSSVSDAPLSSNVLRKVASITLDKATIEQRVCKPRFIPDKLDYQIYEKFEGQMLINWFVSAFNEDHYLRLILTTQDLRILAAQFCTHLLAAGVLHQIPDKDAPLESLFRPDLMYYWSHTELPAPVPLTPGRLGSVAWPPPSPGPALEATNTARPGARYTEAEFQQVVMGLKREHKANLERFAKNQELALFSVRGEHAQKLCEYEERIIQLEGIILSLQQEQEKHQMINNIQMLTEKTKLDFDSPTSEEKCLPSIKKEELEARKTAEIDTSIEKSIYRAVPAIAADDEALISTSISCKTSDKCTDTSDLYTSLTCLSTGDGAETVQCLTLSNTSQTNDNMNMLSNSLKKDAMPMKEVSTSSLINSSETKYEIDISSTSKLDEHAECNLLRTDEVDNNSSILALKTTTVPSDTKSLDGSVGKEVTPPPPPPPTVGQIPPPPPMPLMSPLPPAMPGMAPPPPPMPEMPGMGPPPPPMPGMGPPPPPMPGMGPPPPPMPGIGPPPMPGMGPPPPPMPGMGPPLMPGIGPPPPPPIPGMGPPPPPMPGMGPPPPPPIPGMGPPPPPLMPGMGAPVPPPMQGSGQQSPMPLPPPPVGGWMANRQILRKKPLNPEIPMKPLYWTRIIVPATTEVDGQGDTSEATAIKRKLWENLEEAEIDDLKEFSSLFSRQVVERKPVKKKEEKPNKIQAAKILDSKRSQNVGIFASSLHVDFSEIENAIYHFDTSVVSLEALQQLYDVRATEDELKMIRNHIQNSPDIPLDKPEMFLYELAEIPNFADRIACFMFHAEFEDGITAIENKLNNLKSTCEFLMTSENLKTVFAIILALGNYMNGGNRARGQADGFGLEILSKLKDVKSKDNTVTLLHYIVKSYLKRCEDPLSAELPIPQPGDVDRASIVNFDDLSVDLKQLGKDLEICERKAQKIIEDSTKENLQPFKDKMTDFVTNAKRKLEEEKENLEDCKHKFLAVVAFYQYQFKGEGEISPKDFFPLWSQFCIDFKDIWKKEEQRILKEKAQEAKKIQQKLKEVQVTKIKEGGLKSKLLALKKT